MAISTDVKALIAFKNLFNKSHTYTNKEVLNEEEGFDFVVNSGNVFVDTIPQSPSVAISNGIAEYIVADLKADITSNGHAYFAYYPTGHIKAGQRIKNVIPPSYGASYGVKPYSAWVSSTNNTPIAIGDVRDWVFQYQSGIYYEQNLNTTVKPVKIELYAYTGKLLSDKLTDISSSLGHISDTMSTSITMSNAGTSSDGTGVYVGEDASGYKFVRLAGSNTVKLDITNPNIIKFAVSESNLRLYSSQIADANTANGLVKLNGSTKIDPTYLPDAILGALKYRGTWNATTNMTSDSVVLQSGWGNTATLTKGDYYIVNTAGTTTLDGMSDWQVGDWVIFNPNSNPGAPKGWDKIDNTDKISSVNGLTGIVVLTTDNINEGTTNLYFSEDKLHTSPYIGSITESISTLSSSFDSELTTISNGFSSSLDVTNNTLNTHIKSIANHDDVSFDNGAPVEGSTLIYNSATKAFEPKIVSNITVSLGEAEDGDYSDGLFTDLSSATRVGIFADRVNEVLKALAPKPARPLTSFVATNNMGATGKIAFTSTTVDGADTYTALSAITPSGTSSLAPTVVSVDGTYSASGNRRGVITSSSFVISGNLADNEAVSKSTPVPAYPANAFGEGDKGTLVLELNGVDKVTVDLTNTSAFGTISGTDTNVYLTAATPVSFPYGDPFDSFKFRTGSWRVSSADCRPGWNYIRIKHIIQGSPERNTPYIDFIWDKNITDAVYSGETISAGTFSGSKYLSGVNYYTNGSVNYGIAVDNLYKNTYTTGTGLSYTVDSRLNNVAGLVLPNCNNDGFTQKQITVNPNFTFKSSNIRVIPTDSIIVKSNTTKISGPNANKTSTGVSINSILLDNYTVASDTYNELFVDENRRLPSNFDFEYTGINLTGVWDSTKSLITGGVGYNDGLQIYNGKLVAPSINFTTVTNAPAGQPNYSVVNNNPFNRKYYRAFVSTLATSIFKLTLQGSNVNLIKNSSDFMTNKDVKIFIKIPTQTGWMDAVTDFGYNVPVNTEPTGDGMGAKIDNLSGTVSTPVINSTWGLTTGTKNVSNGGNLLYVQVVTRWDFAGEITKLAIEFYNN